MSRVQINSIMLRPYWGHIGNLSVIIAFVAAIVSAYAYWESTRTKNSSEDNNSWQNFARKAFYLHSFGVIMVCVSLFSIIFNHYFEYHYAWDNSSLSLPLGYAISCFWQDQEGSFLLWTFWNVVLGLIIIRPLTPRGGIKVDANPPLGVGGLQSPVMFIFALVQVFLTSMILGVVFFGTFKIGSTPFLTLQEAMPNMPVWKLQPNFIPKDGNGLNPLLQNYWMVIHPPTLFLGFATTLVPFAYAMAGIWQRKYTEWLKPAMPWAIFSAVILGTGIMMGAIWAYETLSFGGYWSWDPVENAVYIPWLVMVGGFHTMLLAKKSSSALKISFILVITQFILILYSTFLTRSGILGNASVHSFTDLGLSGQLLIYLLTFLFGAIALCVVRWKELPSDEKEISTYSREFWIFIGVTFLCLAAFQVIVTTSIPVYNKVAEIFGVKLNMALPADQVGHYSKFQMWFFVVITALTGVGQYFWWKNTKDYKVFNKLVNPLIISLLISAAFITFGKINNWQYIIVLTVGIFAVVANGSILLEIISRKLKFSGGAVAHIGLALMILGILFSSGYSRIISMNFSGSKLFSDEKENKENAVLWLNRPTQLSDFAFTYKGQYVDVRGLPNYVKKDLIKSIPNDFHGIAKSDIIENGKTYFKKGDTLAYEAENTYYEVEYAKSDSTKYSLFPRLQQNQRMGNVASPDIKKLWNKDIYTHVTYAVLDDTDRQWSKPEEFTVAVKDTFFINDYVAILDQVKGVREVEGLALGENDAAAEATVRILDKDANVKMHPTFVIKNREVWSKPEVNNELGLRLQLNRIDPQTGKFSFTSSHTQREFIVMKALEKPQINLLWIGTLMVILGMIIAIFRRNVGQV